LGCCTQSQSAILIIVNYGSDIMHSGLVLLYNFISPNS
jgi:hypothetical protein